MQLEYINAFVDASCEIFGRYIKDGSLKVGDISLKDSVLSVSGLAAIIGLTNEASGNKASGNVLISFDEKTSDEVVAVMNGKRETLTEDVYYSTVRELANLVAGLAVTKLEKVGFNIGITPPMIVRGLDVRYVTSESEALHVKLESSIGVLNVLVAVIPS